ncbi:hypothetical protein K435DRAFT_796067 [Dendrothele bispora CBS 962.96]|uniref:Uncharacterized protein n=1 Tax=Dendrothele bispora (strain CBS 962.96) TaxID=1314807 RepID=A0A4S8M814_DENBC|nr:hypothetical protein K435DRAFT_796067 [Dendrothele bispora CBS 962.96]
MSFRVSTTHVDATVDPSSPYSVISQVLVSTLRPSFYGLCFSAPSHCRSTHTLSLSQLSSSWTDKFAFSWCWADEEVLLLEHETWTLGVTCSNPHLLLHILDELSFEDWLNLSNMSFFERLRSRLLDFIQPNRIARFFMTLRNTNSVIAGTLPLAMMNLLEWGPGRDLILYCPAQSKGRATSLSVLVTRNGEMMGGECLDDFQPVALMEDMPESYCGARSWKDKYTLVFEWDDFLSDLGDMGGDSV